MLSTARNGQLRCFRSLTWHRKCSKWQKGNKTYHGVKGDGYLPFVRSRMMITPRPTDDQRIVYCEAKVKLHKILVSQTQGLKSRLLQPDKTINHDWLFRVPNLERHYHNPVVSNSSNKCRLRTCLNLMLRRVWWFAQNQYTSSAICWYDNHPTA